MSEPPYGYYPCLYPGCKNQVPTYLNPADFSLHPKCTPCRRMRRTHLCKPFCTHGNVIPAIWERDALCGCTRENNMDSAVWDWVSIERLIQEDELPK